MSEMRKESAGWYKHDSVENCHMFVAKVKAEARRNTNETLAANMAKLMIPPVPKDRGALPAA